MNDPMHDDDPTPVAPTCLCPAGACECEAPLACGIENPELCESCQ